MMSNAENGGRTYLEISARELHAIIGPPRGRNDRMPNCCRVMKAQLATDHGDVIVNKREAGRDQRLRFGTAYRAGKEWTCNRVRLRPVVTTYGKVLDAIK